jgi:hypothetical protein
MAAKDVIRVAADISGKLVIQAKGNPAQIVSYAAAAALTFVGVGIGLGAWETGKWLLGQGKK